MMQDNSFDNNIKQQLHAVSIEPSQDVWVAVEKALDNKKRRYAFGWWSLLPLLVTGIGLVWYFTNDESINESASDKKILTATTNKHTGYNNQNVSRTIATSQASKTVTYPTAGKLSSVPTTATYLKPVLNGSAALSQKFMTHPEHYKPGIVKKEVSEGAKQRMIIHSPAEDRSADSTNIQTSNDTNQPDYQDSALIKTEPHLPISQQEKKDNKKPSGRLQDSLPVTVAQNTRNQKPLKWKKEWVVAAGKFSFSSFNFSNENEEFVFDPTNSGSTPTTPGSNLRERNEYRFKPGIYLGAGLQVNRRISKRTSLMTGLHYNYQGGKVDKRVIVDSLSGIGTAVSYTMIRSTMYGEQLQIHSINIPLLMRFEAHKSINVDAGLYNGFSISTNWNNYSKILGKNKSYLPIFHLNPTFASSKFSVGPFVNIGLRQYNTGRNLVNYGLILRYTSKK